VIKMKIIFTCLLLILTISLSAQQSKLSIYVNYISAYIASEDFNNLKNKIGDIAATDSIYLVAVKSADYNYSEALLALMFATVPYREVAIQIPLINFVLNYPLLSADEETFHKKNNKLPKYLFLDSPSSDYGDKDKLAHFFGSAFLSYESRFFDLGELIGYFVEAFEESFKVQSAIDFRDLDVNEYGRLFGKLLRKNKNLLPSQIILLRSFRYIRIIL
jgi:hypothetical protein